VRLMRQLSEIPCRRGETWGYDRRGIWVDEGCAGVFHITSGRARDDYGYYGYGREYDYDYGRFGRYGREYDRDPYGYGRDYSRPFPGQTVRCESEHFQFNRCPIDTRGDVRLVRQLSETPCRRGETWGYDRRGIWVDEGCAGEFHVSRR